MAQNGRDEEEKMREAIRLAKKWKRIEMPLAIVAGFLALGITLILNYMFQLPQMILIIICIAIVYSIVCPIALYYGNKIDRLTGLDKERFKWDPVPGAEKEAVAIIVSGAASLFFILMGSLTRAGESLAYSITGVGLFCGVVIPLGNRIAKKRHMADRKKLPPNKRKVADEVFEILVYGEKKKEEKEEQRNNSAT